MHCNRSNPLALFSERAPVRVCAPMVRYSKLEFRSLVRKYGCQLCFSPMIIADSFVRSEKARKNEFTTNDCDTPLVVQFAANSVEDFTQAAELVSPYCDGVDLNCGCPQRWAMKEGYGAHLLSNPQMIHEMVSSIRRRLISDFTVSVKIRLLDDLKKTVEMCRSLEAAGISFLTVHGRTPTQRGETVNFEGIRSIVESLRVPVIANGDVKDMSDFENMHKTTKCKGVMCAQGILSNPALFTGASLTPTECIQDWVRIGLNATFQIYHHHLVFMLEKVLPKPKRIIFNNLKSVHQIHQFLYNEMNIDIPEEVPSFEISEIQYNDGSYFKSRISELNTSQEVFLSDSLFLFS